MGPYTVDDFWDELLDFTEKGLVIPVIGEELLVVRDGDRDVQLYQLVAERLLARFRLAPEQPGTGLYQAVSQLVAAGKRTKDLYRVIFDLLSKTVEEHPEVLAPLHDLAGIGHFASFVTTTPDDLLARALDVERFAGAQKTAEIEYAPNLPTDRIRDVPEQPPRGYAAVFYMFGKADVSPFYAVHDEDALEFLYHLQTGGGPERLLSRLRGYNLLIIGCSFADWLNRFFLRLWNTDRLSSSERTKGEYLVGREAMRDVVFLERFSQDSRLYPADAVAPDPRAFVAELARRWRDRNPVNATKTASTSSGVQPAGSGIFISYAHEDLTAARELVKQLQTFSGDDVAWFDKSDLSAGAPWARDIRGAIQRCKLFVPLISATTESRDEGYFREEWTQAAERSRQFSEDRPFIVPVVIDQQYDSDASRYQRVPDQFSKAHFGHAPGGAMTPKLAEDLQVTIRRVRGGRSS